MSKQRSIILRDWEVRAIREPREECLDQWQRDHGRDASVTNPWAWAIGIEKA